MGQLGFTLSRADPDVWFRLSKRSTGEEYYEYVLLYVGNVLIISENAEPVMRKEFGKYWKIKEESIGPPTKYLGGKLQEVELETGVKAWAFWIPSVCPGGCEQRCCAPCQEKLRNAEGQSSFKGSQTTT